MMGLGRALVRRGPCDYRTGIVTSSDRGLTLRAQETLLALMMAEGKRDQILDAAFDRFKQYGYHKTTVDEIARQAQVGKGTIYLHFRNKEEILVELVDRELRKGFALVGQAMAEAATPVEKLRKLLEISIDFFHDNELVSKVLAMDEGLVLSVITDKNRQFQALSVAAIKTLLEQGRNEGAFRAVDCEQVAYIIDSLLRAFHYLDYLDLQAHPPREIFASLFDLLCRGLVSREVPTRP